MFAEIKRLFLFQRSAIMAKLTRVNMGMEPPGANLYYAEDDLKVIDVIAVFEGGKLRPVRFRIEGIPHHIKTIFSSWISSQGVYRCYHFAIQDRNGDHFELGFDSAKMLWYMEKAIY